MARKRKARPETDAHVIELFKLDPARRFRFDHSVPVQPGEPNNLPPEYPGAHPPAVGPDALCRVPHDGSLGELELLRPFVPDIVQICFVVPDRAGPWQPTFQIGYELMWVSVTEAKGNFPNATYRSVLLNLPVFISPQRLRFNSAVTFQFAHVVKNLMTQFASDRLVISIEADSRPWLTVRSRTRKPAYPLTAHGVRQAGRDLYDSGHREWRYMESTDATEDHGSDLDVRVLLEGAFVARAEEFGDTRFSGIELGLVGTTTRSVKEAKEKRNQPRGG
jgi:hypothetical protein